MLGREFKLVSPPVVCLWLPAIVLSLTLQVSLHAQVGSLTVDPAAGDASTTTPSIDIPTVVTPLMLTPQLTPEQIGDRLEAGRHYQAASRAYAQIAQPSATVLNKMGISYQMMHNIRDAMRCYKSSLKLRPDNAEVINNLATAEEMLGDYSAAERDLRKALKIQPNDALALKNLGTNLLMQGKNAQSAETYRRALAINPHVLDDHYAPEVTEDAARHAVGVGNYIKAQSCAQAGLIDCALTNLQRAFNEGSATVKKVVSDAEFANLRGTPALTRLLAQEQ
jgi:tetratricopeptide (TPR) repeat protein